MKRSHKLGTLFTFLFLISATISFSQTIKDFFSSSATQLTYLGIDFTKNLIIKDSDANTADITGRLYNSMNDLVVKEMRNSDNYNIGKAFSRKNPVDTALYAVTANNNKIDPGTIISPQKSDYKRLKENDIADVVNALPLNEKGGIGLVFIMEGMKKAFGKGYGAVWVTLIDMQTKKVLMAERIEHEAEGFGFRNYWVSVIRKTIVDIDWSRYGYWKKKYSR